MLPFLEYELQSFVKLSSSLAYCFNNKVPKERFFFTTDMGSSLANSLISLSLVDKHIEVGGQSNQFG